ncbi:hypothetical protein BDEG_21926 [Batrachochytrium dendrobatidis JEL423]|uniref:Uncharacterized protein n=1 Tax=Batrachochytrium dendrobatidis (strain JEL423) TaxID=403673 RepID=A0A177WCX7_BATDL|nr:hypothetical protein BDEG_21926 [Batrachochytrium dendrobatidis JEL423]
MRPVFLLCTLTCSQLVVAAPLPVFGALSKLKNELFKNHRNPYGTLKQPSPSESAHQTSTVESYSAAPEVTSNEPDLPIVEPYDPEDYDPRMQTPLEKELDELYTRLEEMEEYMEIISADVLNYSSLLSYEQNKVHHKHNVDGFSKLRQRMQSVQKGVKWLEKQIKKTEDKIQHEKKSGSFKPEIARCNSIYDPHPIKKKSKSGPFSKLFACSKSKPSKANRKIKLPLSEAWNESKLSKLGRKIKSPLSEAWRKSGLPELGRKIKSPLSEAWHKSGLPKLDLEIKSPLPKAWSKSKLPEVDLEIKLPLPKALRESKLAEFGRKIKSSLWEAWQNFKLPEVELGLGK